MQNPKPAYSSTPFPHDLCADARAAVKKMAVSQVVAFKSKTSAINPDLSPFSLGIFSDVVNGWAMYNAAHIDYPAATEFSRLSIFTLSVG